MLDNKLTPEEMKVAMAIAYAALAAHESGECAGNAVEAVMSAGQCGADPEELQEKLQAKLGPKVWQPILNELDL